MIIDALASWLHIIGIMAMFSALTVQHLLIKNPLDQSAAKRVFVLGIIAVAAAGLVIATGFARWFLVGKGASFPEMYTKNGLFHTKVLLAVIATGLSVASLSMISGLKSKVAATGEPVEAPRALHHLLRAALALLLIVPLLASLVARGVGSGAAE